MSLTIPVTKTVTRLPKIKFQKQIKKHYLQYDGTGTVAFEGTYGQCTMIRGGLRMGYRLEYLIALARQVMR